MASHEKEDVFFKLFYTNVGEHKRTKRALKGKKDLQYLCGFFRTIFMHTKWALRAPNAKNSNCPYHIHKTGKIREWLIYNPVHKWKDQGEFPANWALLTWSQAIVQLLSLETESDGHQTQERPMGRNGDQKQERTVENQIGDQRQETINGTYSSRSPATMTTLARIQQNRRRAPQPGSTRSYFDNTSPSYGWLLPGWVAEERVMESGRLYKVIPLYDPHAHT